MSRLWRAFLDRLLDVTQRLAPRPEPKPTPTPHRDMQQSPPRAAKLPYDLAKDTSTDNQKYLM